MKVKKVEAVFGRVNNIQKPKEAGSKFGKNIKIDNITIDGNQGDVNWEDFIKINNGDEEGAKKETPDQDEKFDQA